MKMTIDSAIACLSDRQRCKYCKYESENCRHDAINVAVRSMEALRECEKIVGKRMKEVEK